MKIRNLIVVGTLGFSLFSCVPVKQFSDLKKKTQSIEDSNQLLKEENRDLTVQLNELDGKFSTLEHKYYDLEKKSKQLLDQNADLKQENERLNKNQEDLEHQIDLLKDGSSEEITSLLKELQELQNDLQDREDHVKAAEDELKGKEQALKQAQQELAEKQQALSDMQQELTEKQQKLQELQQALNDQKSAVSSLKDKLNAALRGFYDQGLTVHEKNGKVYVSMEEKLLFKTGSYTLGPNGQEALKSLSGVLASNPDIHIMVEGHTDNVPLNGSGQIKDNWDLSVMRATAVAKIILQNSNIDPGRITAAGRSEYVPLDSADNPEARRKNRRTEIILTPDLSQVLKIIEAN